MKTLIVTLLAATALTAISGGAMAADLAMPAMAAPAMAAPAPGNWDGPYIGASVGYGWGTAAVSDPHADDDSTSLSGFSIGVQAGYNFHVADQIVLGIEGNVDWANESGTFNGNYSGNSVRENWDGSVRARLGYDAGQFLPYVEAGVAFLNANNDVSGTSDTYTGWTVGAGIEFMLASNLSVNVDYRYSDYGTKVIDSFPNSMHITDNTVRVGLNYHF